MYLYITTFDDLQNAKNRVLDEYAKTCKRHVSTDRLSNGKPVLLLDNKREGDISVSHTKNCLVVAISEEKVGIDIELKERHISPTICKNIKEWTQYEAYGKYLGTGISKELLNKELPEELITSFEWGDYIISLASNDKKVDIIKLV